MEGSPFILVIHGGCGKLELTPEQQVQHKDKLTESLLAGYRILESGNSALSAVEASIIVLEDSPLFNAGKGSVYTYDETIEMDASIMNGFTGQAGAVCGVKTVKNPITAARAVMEKSKFVLLAGPGAEEFASNQGCDMVDPPYFHDPIRLRQCRQAKEEQQTQEIDSTKHLGTVGAVALDKRGHIVAGTSTGGLSNKRYGRVGDSPIIGAGTYADKNCGISCTGEGEFFIKNVVAYDVAAVMKYKGLPLQEAADFVLNKLGDVGGDGGMICVDKEGNFYQGFNTTGMFRGVIDATGHPSVAIW
eukprot:TRINITY_DN4822_c0_g2_i1.p1 TRINITY_DN4822_c0_g2~~TRINITY_DN4822_c0_g2_i1.p1  ORF type:complete len:303 (-),score=57.99 TRINITY_DN4822_c0_g2_i1:313-1221(-)